MKWIILMSIRKNTKVGFLIFTKIQHVFTILNIFKNIKTFDRARVSSSENHSVYRIRKLASRVTTVQHSVGFCDDRSPLCIRPRLVWKTCWMFVAYYFFIMLYLVFGLSLSVVTHGCNQSIVAHFDSVWRACMKTEKPPALCTP